MLPALFALFTSIALASPAPGVGLATHELSATAPLTANSVWAGLAKGEAALLACVGDPAAPLPTVIRALDLRWTVAPGGKASGLSVEGAEPAGPGLTPCLEAAIGSVTWADPGAAPSTMTARLVVLHNAYATLTRAPASMLPPRTPGDRLNQPNALLGVVAPASPGVLTPAVGSPGRLDPIILGALDRSEIDAVIERHWKKVRACYKKGLKENKALAGTVTLKFAIATDGTVSKSEVKKSTLSAPEVERCMAQAIHRMTFPSPKGGGIVIVSYPFAFSPKESGAR